MKRKIISLLLILTFSLGILTSCDRERAFTHCELTLVLDDSFETEPSEDFDLLISNGDVAVSLIRISFDAALKNNIPDNYTVERFAEFFMEKSGKTETVYEHGYVPYYTYFETVNSRKLFYTVTFYRSYYAYFVVTYATPAQNKGEYADKFLEYASRAYFNDAPTLKSE